MDSMDQPDYEESVDSSSQNKEETKWAAIAHVSTFAGYFFPFGNIIAPFIIYLLKKDELPFVKDQAREAMNFQISVTIYAIVSIILIFLIIGIPILAALVLFEIIVTIIAAVKASEGVEYRYPLTIRFL